MFVRVVNAGARGFERREARASVADSSHCDRLSMAFLLNRRPWHASLRSCDAWLQDVVSAVAEELLLQDFMSLRGYGLPSDEYEPEALMLVASVLGLPQEQRSLTALAAEHASLLPSWKCRDFEEGLGALSAQRVVDEVERIFSEAFGTSRPSLAPAHGEFLLRALRVGSSCAVTDAIAPPSL